MESRSNIMLNTVDKSLTDMPKIFKFLNILILITKLEFTTKNDTFGVMSSTAASTILQHGTSGMSKKWFENLFSCLKFSYQPQKNPKHEFFYKLAVQMTSSLKNSKPSLPRLERKRREVFPITKMCMSLQPKRKREKSKGYGVSQPIPPAEMPSWQKEKVHLCLLCVQKR